MVGFFPKTSEEKVRDYILEDEPLVFSQIRNHVKGLSNSEKVRFVQKIVSLVEKLNDSSQVVEASSGDDSDEDTITVRHRLLRR